MDAQRLPRFGDVPIIGRRAELPEIIKVLVLKPGERLIVTVAGDTDPRLVNALAQALVAGGIERPIITADWVRLSCVEPDMAQLVNRILLLRSAVQGLRDDVAEHLARRGRGVVMLPAERVACESFRNALDAILTADVDRGST